MHYTLLLRGINVGGKNKVAMADLKADLVELGFENPVSYIKSAFKSAIATLFFPPTLMPRSKSV